MLACNPPPPPLPHFTEVFAFTPLLVFFLIHKAKIWPAYSNVNKTTFFIKWDANTLDKGPEIHHAE